MSARKLYEAGYTDIVSVVPPGAQLSPNSKIEPEMLGKVPGKRGKKGWYGYSFTTEPATAELAARIDETGANVGLLADRFPALDIDVSTPGLRNIALRYAFETLGRTAPIRLSREPRRLLVFRTDDPFSRLQLIVKHKKGTELIEILGAGQQYLVHGKHPSGTEYRWEGAPLWRVAPEKLPVISRDSALAYLQALKAHLETQGLQCEIKGDGLLREAKAPETQEELLAPSIDALRDLVKRIPNNADSAPTWDDYIKFGHAIKAAGANDEAEALEIYVEWVLRCERVPGDEDDARQHWERMHPPHRVGWGWLVEQAEQFGGYNSAQQEFEPDPGAVPVAAEDKPPTTMKHITFTDEWACAQIFHELKQRVRFAKGAGNSGEWFTWEGYRWQLDRTLKAERIVRSALNKLAVSLDRRANELEDEKAGRAFRAAAKRYQSADGITSVIRLLRARVPVLQEEFDRDPMMLNTPGGVVDLRTGEISRAKPEQLLMRSTAVAPAPGEAPMWNRFLSDLTGGDEQLIRFVQKMVGYSLTGEISEKSLWFIWGSDSDTGKSTFIRTLRLLFGDYADTVDIDAFVGGRERIPADLARLPGVRLVTAAEPAAGQSWDERRIKAITGGDEISARFLYGQWFTYVPQFKIIIVGNHEPEIRNVDDAMLRRIQILPFNRKVAREKQVPDLAQKMFEQEGPQILQWIVAGCLAWQSEGLTPPAVVRAKTTAYADEEDTLAQWLQEECLLDADATVTRQDLYGAWSAWCRSRGEDAGGMKAFKGKLLGKMSKLPISECQVGERRLRGYKGIRLRLATEERTEFTTL